ELAAPPDGDHAVGRSARFMEPRSCSTIQQPDAPSPGSGANAGTNPTKRFDNRSSGPWRPDCRPERSSPCRWHVDWTWGGASRSKRLRPDPFPPDLCAMKYPRIDSLLRGGALLVCSTLASAQVAFDPATNVPVGQRPSGLAAGDFSGD